MSRSPKVIDFFCGAGGFSEGFRQQGFEVVMGIEHWKKAVQTHDLNHGLSDAPMDVLSFEGKDDPADAGLRRIQDLPDSEVIVGSPPCVSFSMSNKAGKADKSLGIRLIEAYLRVIAVKKHQKGSVLKAWLMENVPRSREFVKKVYKFRDLQLGEWAKEQGRSPGDKALHVQENGDVLCAADYGSPQVRSRFICGEVLPSEEFPYPVRTHAPRDQSGKDPSGLVPYVTLGDIIGRMPSPASSKKNERWVDPNYPQLEVPTLELTDHFYDPGVYEVEWEAARFAKLEHPFMGRMSFPEDRDRPSRTIMATRSASTRESLLYPSEWGHKGDGEYRLPTIREAASLMGFPFNYQFEGSEGTKWKQIGNAVCPHMSAALAKEVRKHLGNVPLSSGEVFLDDLSNGYKKVNDLNTFKPGRYEDPPKRKPGARFRRHPFKGGGMTVALTNYYPDRPIDKKEVGNEWFSSIYLGSGKKYDILPIGQRLLKGSEQLLLEEFPIEGREFIEELEKKIIPKVPSANELQRLYEGNGKKDGKLDPITLIRSIKDSITKFDPEEEVLELNGYELLPKDRIPKRQLFAIYALGKCFEGIRKKTGRRPQEA